MKTYSQLFPLLSILLFYTTAGAVTITPPCSKIPNATISAPQPLLQEATHGDVRSIQVQSTTSIPFAARHMPTYAGENAPAIESSDTRRHKPIRVRVQNPQDYIFTSTYTAQKLTQDAQVHSSAAMVVGTAAETSANTVSANTETAASSTVSVLAIWRDNNKQLISNNTPQTTRNKRRAAIIDPDGPDDPDLTDPDYDDDDNANPIGDIPFIGMALLTVIYMIKKNTTTTKQHP